MSHLSQLVSESLANGRVGDGVKMHQPSRDRVQLNHDGQVYYVVCVAESDMMRIKDGLEVAYEEDATMDRIVDRFTV